MEKDFGFLETIPADPGNLIKGLQLLQATEGYISNEGIRAAAKYFNRPEADVEGVVSFYDNNDGWNSKCQSSNWSGNSS